MAASLHPTPALQEDQPSQAASRPGGAGLSLEARLAAVEAAMTVRLDEAAVAHEVRTAHLATTPVNLTEVVRVPLTPTSPAAPPPTYTTPVAALLERAHRRMETDGWCAGAMTDKTGAVCLIGAIRKEARGDRALETDAASLVLDAIRRRFGDDTDSVPAFNDAHGSGHIPARMLGEAASLADAKSL
ncbi:hypothetical protein ABTZ58_37055 [Streptomyces sp. NPDC094143]|uniref:DUF6197 family protein n=1 Tax=Streptomyces sp. NPDC094143 TaxID=3155310 RepID=UPI0033262ABC